MRNAFKSLAALAVVLTVVVVARAEEDKKPAKTVTLKGEIGCPKCVFGVKGVKACGNAIKVTKDGKDTIYIFVDAGKAEKYHGKICTEGKQGSVTGVVSKKGDQMMIKPTKDGVKFE